MQIYNVFKNVSIQPTSSLNGKYLKLVMLREGTQLLTERLSY